LKNSIDGLYLHFLPNAIEVENYFFENGSIISQQNTIIKGDFDIHNGAKLKINPYQADVVNEGLENLLFLDGEAYNQEKYKDFKVDLVLKNIKFENGNTSYINENNELCGIISYAIIIEDLKNGASKMFDLDDTFLVKNITKEMIMEHVNYLIDNSAVFSIESKHYQDLYDANLEHTIISGVIQTLLLLIQIFNIININVSSVTLP
jgi:hypothetical protein